MKIYNTLTRKKEPFQPRIAGKVGMYVCGMTVYDYCHIGHARVMVVFDTVARYLRHKGYELTYVRNITDIDDKIINRANENGEDFTALTQRFIDAMHEDERALNVLPPDLEPKATQSIPDIIAMIETLIAKGLAYVGSNGDVFYSVSKFQPYGKLSGKNLADLQAGERIDVDKAKQDPLDFVLWKMAKPGEPSWESPWGQGRPGWHIECSAMSTCCLGNHFDIHGGGMDLQFPHHENEIAQSEGATGEKFVNVWMHNGFVRVDNEKMSKSLGNFFTVREVLQHFNNRHAEATGDLIRFFILSSHYRSPLNYSDEQLNEASRALKRLYNALTTIDDQRINDIEFLEMLGFSSGVIPIFEEYEMRFEKAMDDDFNTPIARSILFELVDEINKSSKLVNEGTQKLINRNQINKEEFKEHQQNLYRYVTTLKLLSGLLGILQHNPIAFLQGEMQDKMIETKIFDRVIAKQSKNWALADQIRDDLKQQGVILEDKPDGTTSWRRE